MRLYKDVLCWRRWYARLVCLWHKQTTRPIALPVSTLSMTWLFFTLAPHVQSCMYRLLFASTIYDSMIRWALKMKRTQLSLLRLTVRKRVGKVVWDSLGILYHMFGSERPHEKYRVARIRVDWCTNLLYKLLTWKSHRSLEKPSLNSTQRKESSILKQAPTVHSICEDWIREATESTRELFGSDRMQTTSSSGNKSWHWTLIESLSFILCRIEELQCQVVLNEVHNETCSKPETYDRKLLTEMVTIIKWTDG